MIIETPAGEVTLRPFAEQDVKALISYVYDSPTDYLERIGFALDKLPGREKHEASLRKGLKSAPTEKLTRVAAELNQRTLALVYLQLRKGASPRGHFHIFDSKLRGLGLGGPILKNGLKMLMEQHEIKTLDIEPKADNRPMNRLMEKCGFEFRGESVFESPTTSAFRSHIWRFEI